MPRAKTTQTPTPEGDPLADLRQDDGPQAAPAPPLQVIPPADLEDSTREALEQADESGGARPLVTKEVQDDMVHVAVAALHVDLTCQGFLHGGGACGCNYIARTVLQAAVPVASQRDQEDPRTHGGNHAPLKDGDLLDPGFCVVCDREREERGQADG